MEKDSSVELQSVTAAFPGTTSIKYRNPGTQVMQLYTKRPSNNSKKIIIWICSVDGHHLEEKIWIFYIV